MRLLQALSLPRRYVLSVVFDGKVPQHYVDTGKERQQAEQEVKPSCNLILF